MALVRSPLQTEMNRLFTTFLDTPTGRVPTGQRRWLPAFDLVESDEAYVLRADLPGVADEDVTVQLEDGLLTISGQRESVSETERAGVVRRERAAGRFSRSVRLPDGVDPDAVTAAFDRGVLEVTVPKPEARKPRRVEIAVGGGQAQETIEA